MIQRSLRVALVQMNVLLRKSDNITQAEKLISEAAKNRAELICLPECFNCPYGPKYFRENCESIQNGLTADMLSRVARRHSVYLVGGFPTGDKNGNIYNTLSVWNPEGNLLAQYDKIHLFDVFLPGEEFFESAYFVKGNKLVTFKINKINLKIELGMCYDLMFPELARLYFLKGCEMIIFSSAYPKNFGQIYFELLQRSRAADNQCFVLGVNTATAKKGHISWGHSQIIGPKGNIMAKAGHAETIIYSTLAFDECEKVRQETPTVSHRRTDIYDIIEKRADSNKLIN